MENDEISITNTRDAAEMNEKPQVLSNEILWLVGKHFLRNLQDIYSLATSSRTLWRIMSVELYTTAIEQSKKSEIIEDVRKFVPNTTLLPSLDTRSAARLLILAENIRRVHGSAQTTLPGILPDTPWRDFFRRHRMSRDSPLHQAAAHGYTTVASRLLQVSRTTWPKFIDAKNPIGDTAIHLASQNGHFDIVKLLVDAGSSKRHPSRYFYYINARQARIFPEVSELSLPKIVNFIVPGTMKESYSICWLRRSSPRFAIDALGLAIANGHQKIAHFLMEFYDEDLALKWHLVSPVHLASVFGQCSILEELLAGGVDVDLPSWHFDMATPLHLASASNKGIEVLRILKSHGANLDTWDRSNRTPLQWAVQYWMGDNMMRLVELGAKVDADVLLRCFRRDGWRPYAEKILETLERSPEALWDGPDTICLCTQKLIKRYMGTRHTASMKYIIKNRIGLGPRDPRKVTDAECFDWEGTSSLHVAAESHWFPERMFKLLLEQRAVDVNLRNESGLTALDMAGSSYSKEWKVRLLQEYGGVTAQQLTQGFLECQQPRQSNRQ